MEASNVHDALGTSTRRRRKISLNEEEEDRVRGNDGEEGGGERRITSDAHTQCSVVHGGEPQIRESDEDKTRWRRTRRRRRKITGEATGWETR